MKWIFVVLGLSSLRAGSSRPLLFSGATAFSRHLGTGWGLALNKLKPDCRRTNRNDKENVIQGRLFSFAPGGATREVQQQNATRLLIPSDVTLSPWALDGAAGILSGFGFLESTVLSLVTDMGQFQSMVPLIIGLAKFLKTDDIGKAMEESFNLRLFANLIILSRIQRKAFEFQDRRDSALSDAMVASFFNQAEAARYMKYATAAYGRAMMMAAEEKVLGKTDPLSSILKDHDDIEKIKNHTGVKNQNITLQNVTFVNGNGVLRYFIAEDHENQKVILAIRGTFTLTELVEDLVGYNASFCGGQAHSQMATLTKVLWSVAGEDVCKALSRHPDYELIITGHSLGAGAACLLNIHLHNDGPLVNQTKRCFAYASPPVFSPHNATSKAVKTTINFIHENDIVPFLSVASVRRLLRMILAVDQATKDMKWKRTLLLYNLITPDQSLIDVVEAASRQISKEETVLAIPAMTSFWLRNDGSNGLYDVKACDSMLLAGASSLAPVMHQDMIFDHFPQRYEYAFSHIQIKV